MNSIPAKTRTPGEQEIFSISSQPLYQAWKGFIDTYFPKNPSPGSRLLVEDTCTRPGCTPTAACLSQGIKRAARQRPALSSQMPGQGSELGRAGAGASVHPHAAPRPRQRPCGKPQQLSPTILTSVRPDQCIKLSPAAPF